MQVAFLVATTADMERERESNNWGSSKIIELSALLANHRRYARQYWVCYWWRETRCTPRTYYSVSPYKFWRGEFINLTNVRCETILTSYWLAESQIHRFGWIYQPIRYKTGFYTAMLLVETRYRVPGWNMMRGTRGPVICTVSGHIELLLVEARWRVDPPLATWLVQRVPGDARTSEPGNLRAVFNIV